MSGVDERDERDEADEHVDLLLRGAELFRHPGAYEQGAEVPAVLARPDERVASPQSSPELVERAARGLPPHEVCELQLLQQAADDLHVLREPPARVTVAARRQRGLHDHGHQAERVHAHQLRHVRRLPQQAPEAARAAPRVAMAAAAPSTRKVGSRHCRRHLYSYTGEVEYRPSVPLTYTAFSVG
jgi:hypothetical protein